MRIKSGEKMKKIDDRMLLAIKYNDGKSLEKRFFNIESAQIAEEQLIRTRTGNPISDAITGNKIWNDHLVRIGVRK